jgi:hypothetical protein
MRKSEIVHEILDELIKSGSLTIKDLGRAVKIPIKELVYILRELEFLNLVNIRYEIVYLSSQTYSLLFDVVIASEGLEEYLKRRLDKETIRETRTIPGFLVPILLLRAAIPYFGVMLEELKKNDEIRIDRSKLRFLLEYFSSRKMAYSSIADWKNIDFDIDEFYDLWIALNRKLLDSVKLKRRIDYPRRPEEHGPPTQPLSQLVTPTSTDTKSRTASSSYIVEDKYFGVPESSVKSLFGLGEERRERTQIIETSAGVPPKLRRIVEADISLPKMLRFIKEYKNKTDGLVITVYDKALRWQFRGRKLVVPVMFLLEDGIYVDEQDDVGFPETDKLNQARYLMDCVKASKDLYGYEEGSQEEKKVV